MKHHTLHTLSRWCAFSVLTLSAGAQTLNESGRLKPLDGAQSDFFGQAAAIHGTTAAIASPADDDMGSNSGSVYLFDTRTGEQKLKLLPLDG